MSREELHQLGCRLRRAARGELLDYLDGTLPLLIAGSVAAVRGPPVEVPKAAVPAGGTECPVCAAARKRKAAAQKRWRKKHST
jgi:hypothetical protein